MAERVLAVGGQRARHPPFHGAAEGAYTPPPGFKKAIFFGCKERVFGCDCANISNPDGDVVTEVWREWKVVVSGHGPEELEAQYGHRAVRAGQQHEGAYCRLKVNWDVTMGLIAAGKVEHEVVKEVQAQRHGSDHEIVPRAP